MESASTARRIPDRPTQQTTCRAAAGAHRCPRGKNAALAGANDNLKITINGLVDELDALAAELAAIKGQEVSGGN